MTLNDLKYVRTLLLDQEAKLLLSFLNVERMQRRFFAAYELNDDTGDRTEV